MVSPILSTLISCSFVEAMSASRPSNAAAIQIGWWHFVIASLWPSYVR